MDITKLEQISSQVRRDCLRMVHAVQSGHPGGALGCADILVALYGEFMKYDPKNFTKEGKNEDVFFLSNGHISAAWYSVLARFGFFPVSELATFRKLNSRLQGHPTPVDGLPGIRVASGSLGQGLSVAIGMANSKKINNDKHVVYCLMGDGEMQEGQVWEALLYGGGKKVDNLVAIIDYNNKQIDGDVDNVLPLGDIKAKLEAFGWNTFEMDGNCFKSIDEVMGNVKNNLFKGKPIAIVMHTHMGQGVDFMIDDHKWHGVPPSDEQLASALSQLKETLGDY